MRLRVLTELLAPTGEQNQNYCAIAQLSPPAFHATPSRGRFLVHPPHFMSPLKKKGGLDSPPRISYFMPSPLGEMGSPLTGIAHAVPSRGFEFTPSIPCHPPPGGLSLPPRISC